MPLCKNKGSINTVENYRSITLTCSLLKIYERCIHCLIIDILKSDLNVKQHGFRPKHSTLSNLIDFYTNVNCYIDRGSPVDIVSFDLSKAFDELDHSILLYKLKKFGFNNQLLLFLKKILNNRKQVVLIDNVYSDVINVTSGVPQGSVLGPVLFTIYINDIFDIKILDTFQGMQMI